MEIWPEIKKSSIDYPRYGSPFVLRGLIDNCKYSKMSLNRFSYQINRLLILFKST